MSRKLQLLLLKNMPAVCMVIIIFFGFLLRLLLVPFGIHQGDFNAWLGWGETLWQYGFAQYYDHVWSDRLPGTMPYLLWAAAWLHHSFGLSNELVYKLPANIADSVLAYIIFLFSARRWGEWKGLAAGCLYAALPVAWNISALWGQMDSVQALALVAVILVLLRGNHLIAAALWSAIFLFKPHSIIFAPLFVLIMWQRNPARVFSRKIGSSAIVALGSIWLLSFPFTREMPGGSGAWLVHPFELVWKQFRYAVDLYPYASLHALNFWTLLGLNWVPDVHTFAGMSYHAWGIGLFVGFLLLILSYVWRTKKPAQSSELYFLAAAAISLVAYTFLTRVHDRHGFPFLAFYLFVIWIAPVRRLTIYLVAVMATLSTLYYSYIYQMKRLAPFSNGTVQFISLIMVIVAVAVVTDLGFSALHSKQLDRRR